MSRGGTARSSAPAPGAGALLALAVVAGAALPLLGCRASVPLNVVVVVVDTLRRDHLAAYGYERETAPFLSSLAARGAVFAGRAPSSWTKPSTASLLTGLHPVRHQAIDRDDALPAAALTLAERLRAEGYSTLGFSGNGWVHATFGFDQGFDRFVGLDNVPGEALNAHALPELAAAKEPFFAYVHYVDPHLPYAPAVDWQGQPWPPSRPQVTVEEVAATRPFRRPAELLRRATDAYDGEIRAMDDALRALTGTLAARGVLDRTVLVFTSDHGEELEDHGRMSHGQSLYEEVLRVPLIVAGPRVPAGRHGDATLEDVVPTLLDLLGLEPWAGDGNSLVPRLRGTRAAARGHLAHLDFADGTALAWHRAGHKVVLARRPYVKALFDLASDAGERHDLLAGRGGARWDALASELSGRFNALSRRALDRQPATVPASRDRALAALGYVDTDVGVRTREIPRRVHPADATPGGRLGWEPSRPPPCLATAAPLAERLLFGGWYYPEEDGRWTAELAAALLGRPPGDAAARLEIRGVNYRPDSPRVDVTVAGAHVGSFAPANGAYEVALPLASPPREASTVTLTVAPPFVPSEHGSQDARALGLFVRSICLAAPAGS